MSTKPVVDERQDEVRCVGRAGALQGDDRIGDGELGDAARGERVRVGLVGVDVDDGDPSASTVCGSAPVLARPSPR